MRVPENDNHTKYIPSSWEAEMSLTEIIHWARGYFPEANFDDIRVSHEEIQVDHFGYDLYDSSDWRWYWVFRCTTQSEFA